MKLRGEAEVESSGVALLPALNCGDSVPWHHNLETDEC